jgi:hypothetical protein
LKYYSFIPFPQPSAFFQRRIIDEVGLLDEALHYGMDYDLLIKIALGNYPILKTDEIYSKYRLHSNSKSVSNLVLFLEDWQKIFSKFLRTIPDGKNYILWLTEINMYRYGEGVYLTSKKFTDTELKLIFNYFLEIQANMYYQINAKSRVAEILKLIKEISPDFYDEKKLSKIYLRNKFLPVFALNTVRKWKK